MLSYQHGYHAGNFADVIKHTTLTLLIDYLLKKDKPFLYLETHAGRGLYDLVSAQSLKTKEAEHGIHKLWKEKNKLPQVFNPYLKCLQDLNPQGQLRHYPGSPYIAMQMLRAHDRLYCTELHPKEYEYLAQLKHRQKNVHFSHSDGLDALKSLLPPPERRALIFIDPSFEMKEDYRTIPALIKNAYKKFETGVYCLWYPLIGDSRLHNQLIKGMQNIGAKSNLKFEFYFKNPSESGMTGCGLWLINPPFVLEEQLVYVGKTTSKFIGSEASSYTVSAD